MQIRVQLSVGSGEQQPLQLLLGRRQVEVRQVLERWTDPNYHYFKLLGDDGRYVIRYDPRNDLWHLTLFDSRFEFSDDA